MMRSLLCLLSILTYLMSGSVASAQPRASPPIPKSYEDAARTVMASIQKTYFDEKTGFYAQSTEKHDPEFIWGNRVMFSAVVAAARYEPETYRPILDQFFGAMDRYWDAKAKIPGYEPAPTSGNGHDKYYDDNQWMVITFMEAHDLTRDVKYLDRAQETLKFSLSGWDDGLGGGIWWHEQHKDGSKNTCANGPAAAGALRLARYREQADNVAWARKIIKWTTEHLQDTDGLFLDNQRVDNGKINRTKFTYNSALMLRANLGMYRATGDKSYLAAAKRIGTAADGFMNKKTGMYRDSPKFNRLMVEADLELYRVTREPTLLARAKRNGDAAIKQWPTSPPKELIEQASIARMLWLLADQETKVGKEFWAKWDMARGSEK